MFKLITKLNDHSLFDSHVLYDASSILAHIVSDLTLQRSLKQICLKGHMVSVCSECSSGWLCVCISVYVCVCVYVTISIFEDDLIVLKEQLGHDVRILPV